MIAIVLALALAVPTLLWVSVVGNPLGYLAPEVPDGQLLYVLSKLAGLLAAALLTVQLALTVARDTRFGGDGLRWSTAAHVRVGVAAIAIATLHVALFVAAASARSEHLALQLLVPRWDSGFYDSMVSVGVIALYLALAVATAGMLARRRRRVARRPHRALVLVLAPLVVVHSYAIGSETESLPMIAFYALLVATALVGMVRAVTERVSGRRGT